MVSSIEINNFTVFKNISIDFCDGVNVIIGENSSGKTHLLKFLYAEILDENNTCQFFGINDEVNLIAFNSDGNTLIKITRTQPSIPIKQVIFIPAKEMLSHSKGLLAMSEKYSRDMPFDKTLLDIIKKAQAWKPDVMPELAVNIVPKLEKVIDGKVFMKDDNSFWVRKNDGAEIPFSMEAEGLRKFGLLWQLLMNEGITKDTILLWDEPEANLNPQLFSILVDILLELSRNGVQIFVATHSNNFAEYLNINKTNGDKLQFHVLTKTNDNIICRSSYDYNTLPENPIESANIKLYEDTLDSVFGEM